MLGTRGCFMSRMDLSPTFMELTVQGKETSISNVYPQGQSPG